MAVVPIRFGLVGRKVRATLTEVATGAAADISAGGTMIVTLYLRSQVNPWPIITRLATISANGGVSYTLTSADFTQGNVTGCLPPGSRWWAWWVARSGRSFSNGFDIGHGVPGSPPNGSDTGEYPEDSLDEWQVSL